MSKKPNKSTGKEKDALSQTPVKRANLSGEPMDKLSELQEILRQRDRALEIEAALERVRARSMAMQSSEELSDVLSVLFQQFDRLGIDPLTVWLTLWNPEENTFTYRSTGISGKRIQGQQVVDIQGMDIWKDLYDKWKSGASEDVEVLFYAKEDLGQLFTLMAETFESMPKAERLTAAHFPEGGYSVQGHCKFGYIGYTHTAKPTEEEQDILSRFAKEFGRVYQHFLDLKKAEAQAREAQIEAALERVRSCIMAMGSPEDLKQVAAEVRRQIELLGQVDLEVSVVHLYEKDSPYFHSIAAIPEPDGEVICMESFFPVDATAETLKMMENYWTGKQEYSIKLTRQKAREWQQILLKNNPDLGVRREEIISNLPLPDQPEYWNFSDFSGGSFLIVTHAPPTPEALDLLRRSAKIFDLAYRRFLDLKKAEAQAREAQIEAALERVRARSMAMHSTKELLEVVVVLFNQLKALEVDFIQAWISIWHLDEGYFEMWLSPIAGHGDQPIYHHQPSAQFEDTSVKTWLKGDQFSYVSLPGEEVVMGFLVQMDELLGGHYFEELQKKNRYDRLEFVDANHKYGTVSMSRHATSSEEDRETLYRFAKVFEQTYTRFLDLQRAEDQTREAKIEAALERVRSKTMAMHNSQDVSETVATLFEEVKKLGLDASIRCGIGILEGYDGMETWSANAYQDGEIALRMGMLNMDIHPMLRGLKKAWENGELGYQYDYDREDVQRYYKALNNEPEYPFNADLKRLPEKQFHNSFFFSEGILFSFTDNPLTEEAKNILRRFASVFGQTYRRYLDLQKAEAQAREAQVEASLERVRSKTMAMHNSQDVSDTVITLFEEVVGLGLDTSIRCGIGIHHENNRMETWSVKSDLKGEVDLKMGMLNMGVHPMLVEITKARKKGVKRFYHELIGEDVTRYYSALNQEPEYPFRVDLKTLPDKQYNNVFFFRDGVLFAFTHNPLTEEAHRVLERFASVFGQTYRRYLDLQKAEAQAREARIEAALEKVRSRSLAMHSTDELNDVLCVLFEQFDLLGINPVLTHLTLFDEDNDTFSLRITTSPENKVIAEQIIDVKAVENWKASFENWKNGDTGTVDCIHYTPDVLPALWEVLHEVMDALPKAYQIKPDDFPDGLYTTQGHCKYGYLGFNHSRLATEGEKKIVARFASEFGRLYQRFLDLQTAEKQARESEIQLALERVRARTMAMHKSSELSEVAAVLFEQIESLGATPERMNIGIIREDEGVFEWWSTEQGGKQIDRIFKGELREPTTISKIYAAWKEGRTSIEFEQSGKELRQWIRYLTEVIGLPFDNQLLRDRRVQSAALFKHGCLLVSTPEFLTEEEVKLLERFSSVFEQTYTRFTDLKKAEAQVREAEIQLSLERIRARAMAMQESSELAEVLSVIFQQLKILGVETVWTHLTLLHQEENAFTYRMTGRNGKRIMAEERIALDASEHWAHISDSIKSPDTDPDPITRFEVPTEGLDAIWELFDGIFSKLPKGEKVSPRDFPNGLYTTQAYCKFGFLGINQTREANPEEADILLRFTTEFSRLYQRFLDLQNAEKRAQEAQIEAALERIRARAMAMQQTEELNEVIGLLCEQYDFLGINPVCAHLSLIDLENNRFSLRLSGKKGARNVGEKIIDLDAMEEWKETVERWKKSIPRSHQCLVYPKESVTQLFQVMDELVQSMPKKYRVGPKDFPNGLYSCEGQNKFGYLGFNHSRPPTEEEIAIVIRFAREFERIYQRFLDLEKAEAQAREAEIEASLERVRAKTMAMHNTEDIADTVITFFDELIGLGLGNSARCGIGILNQSQIMEVWTASIQNKNKSTLHTGFLEMGAHPMLKGLQEHWAAGKALYESVLKGANKMSYFKAINKAPDYPVKVDLKTLPPAVYHYSFLFPQGTLFVFAESPLQEEIRDIFTRFSSVFGQTYTRYLDLERAEKQARESKIEAALERVRAKAMAMHSSEDLRETITTIFEELKNINIRTLRLGLGLLDQGIPKGEIVTARIGDNDDIIEVSGTFKLTGHPVLEEIYTHFKAQRDYFPILQGDEIGSYYAALTNTVDVEGHGTDSEHYGCFLFFNEGGLYAWASRPHSEEEVSILKKFCRVVEITYRRYQDLVEAEAREKDAVKQASLDRVRAEIASMRTAKDLERITPLVWEELIILGIPFFRCGVFIMDETRQLVHVYLTTPAGKALGAMDLPFDFDMPFIQKGVDHWRRQKILVEEWNQAQFVEMTQKLMEQGQVKSAKSYQAGEKPPERLVLHQVPFAQGMLYVGNTEPLTGTEIDVVKALTRTFAVAYARYEDFKELEKAKKKVENTLNELQAAQSQLIQSEKMASLGELTAGIAHEIKNPLNFVNNFSEVSRELLVELMEEMEKGDMEEVKALTEDLVQNLEKIVHHGKRADSIVKGMLQHSRTSDGHRESTDLNALTDEYVRLAYHGLRAKDKSFNATVNTHFDPGLGTLDVVPQDIGRVILNLLTNAFYAVSEKSVRSTASENGKYEPTVTIQTKREKDHLEISVSDNGDGMPKKVLEKIFQPFFTTKPTGQGTGLGLSLSYDIVKAHGGELKVETTQGEGTTFSMNFKTETT